MIHSRGIPEMIVRSSAPVRICDLGGWTDTWFAEHGELLTLAVTPRVEVEIKVYPAQNPAEFLIRAENFQDEYIYQPGMGWQKHLLIEASLDSLPLPPNAGLEISISSEMPPGASTGTSAAVAVALLGALDGLTPGRMTKHELAYAAWRVETERLGQQSGVQDQLTAAYGGISWIEMPAYPQASVTALNLPARVRTALEKRLTLIYLGTSHQSSQVHEMVIRRFEQAGPEAEPLPSLRDCARRGREALTNGDLEAFGQVMVQNHEAQRKLHPELISPLTDELAAIARRCGAAGWKTNGAGGDGGSLTVLGSADLDARNALGAAIRHTLPQVRVIPMTLATRGVMVEISEL